MSVYCTLPRPDRCNLARRKTWSHGEKLLRESSGLNDNLELEDVLCADHQEKRSESDLQMNMIAARNYRSEMCINELTDPPPSQKLYYAVDSFDDVIALRRSSVCSLSPDYTESSPNFYGDADSAYESSNESIRLAKDVRKSSSKYFTLPSKFGRKLKKLNGGPDGLKRAVSASASGNSCPEEKIHPTNLPEMRISEDVNQRNGSLNGVQEDFHCCCRMGCHENPMGLNRVNDQNRLHCCQQTLETVWEEPGHGHAGYESQMMTVFENSLSSMSSKLHQLNLVNQQKDVEINQLRAHLESLSVSQSESSSWLKGSVTKAFRRKSRLKPPSQNLTTPARYPQISYGAAINCYGYSVTTGNTMMDPEMVYKLERQLEEKAKLIQEMKLDSLNLSNQAAALKATIEELRNQISHLQQENQKLQDYVNSRSYSASQETRITSDVADRDIYDLSAAGRRVTIYCGTQQVGVVRITPKTSWEQMDSLVYHCFSQNNLYKSEICSPNLFYYEVGFERVRRYLIDGYKNNPELLPFGYLVEDNSVHVTLQDQSRF